MVRKTKTKSSGKSSGRPSKGGPRGSSAGSSGSSSGNNPGSNSSGGSVGGLRRVRTPGWVNRPIVLVGLMGAGKTTIGRRIARALSLRFVDSDQEIEKAAQMSIAEIFELYGEAEFRALERRVIERLMDSKPKVIATGGGAFIDADTRKMVKAQAVSLWLDADVEVLVERTARKNTRPLLLNRDPAEVLTALMQERGPFYTKADLRVKSEAGPHKMIVRNCIDALEDHMRMVPAAARPAKPAGNPGRGAKHRPKSRTKSKPKASETQSS